MAAHSNVQTVEVGVSQQPVRALLHGEYRASSDRCRVDSPPNRIVPDRDFLDTPD